MDDRLLMLLGQAKRQYEPEGFILLGVFGSRARGDYKPESDLDLLYRVEDRFLDRFPGWEIFARLEDIKQELTGLVGLQVDLANRDGLHTVAQKYILPEVVDVA